MNHKKKIWVVVSIIFLVSFLLRIYYLFQVKSTSGGDAFEFLLIGRRILNLENPFLGVKRLPVYPLTLLPGHTNLVDGVLWGRLISIFFASGSLIVLYLINTVFKINRFVNLLSLIFLSVNQVYFWFSLRPLSYPLYTFLFLLTIYLLELIKLKKLKPFYLGLILGLLSMTRHEGFLVSAIIFIYLISYYKRSFRKLFSLLRIFILITLPFYVHNFLYFGNPLYVSYLEQGGLYQPSNFNQLVTNTEKIFKSVVGLWGKVPFKSNNLFLANFPLILVLFGLFGFVIFLKKYGKQGRIILSLLLGHLIISLWFRPGNKYLQQSIPFIALFTSLGVWFFASILIKRKIWYLKLGGITFIFLIILSTAFVSQKMVSAKVRVFNIDTANQHAITEAIKYLADKSGKVGLEPDDDYTRSYIALFYLGEERTEFIGEDFLGRGEIPKTAKMQMDWVKKKNIKYIIDYQYSDIFSLFDDGRFSKRLDLINKISTPAGEVVTLIYEVK